MGRERGSYHNFIKHALNIIISIETEFHMPLLLLLLLPTYSSFLQISQLINFPLRHRLESVKVLLIDSLSCINLDADILPMRAILSD